MSINIRNQILKKIKKETSVNKLKKKNTFKKVYSPKSSNLKTSSGLKTPLKSIKKIIRKTEIKTVGNFKKKDSRVVNKSINKAFINDSLLVTNLKFMKILKDI